MFVGCGSGCEGCDWAAVWLFGWLLILRFRSADCQMVFWRQQMGLRGDVMNGEFATGEWRDCCDGILTLDTCGC